MNRIKRILYHIGEGFKNFFKSNEDRDEIKLNKLREYAENLMVKCGIDLENVMVHNNGLFGQQGVDDKINVTCNGDRETIKISKPHIPYIIVPEVKDLWTFRAWIHEIGHYVCEHYLKHDSMFVYEMELEAEQFCVEFSKKCPYLSYSDLFFIRMSACDYLETHVVKYAHSRKLTSAGVLVGSSIDNKVREFLPKYRIDRLEKEIKKINYKKYLDWKNPTQGRKPTEWELKNLNKK
ncbi:MAG: hypothetical protein SLAVMIC_00029 [uncultured marine phage]|uniref:IrrE N-terminal-like domain-containing protein n=1 Tax=uncultured marine phage TaxID=707152 RepID=A0A8D9C885_9VIRU|nr:MAG: hypothetical protein SLAVMIC_00029 [uncultured marine phage]